MQEFFWVPLLLTLAIILISLILFQKSLKNKSIQQIPTQIPTSPPTDSVVDGKDYEVFLSFRGTDTRKVFTDFLYTYLVSASIRTFRDDNELRVGEEIGPDLLKAINESKISIPVFSKNYASSKWCLRELAQMVECQANGGQMIFPIFYDVDPSEVQHQRGSYEKAFRQYKRSLDEKTVQQWEKAMTIVGELKGLELKKETNGCEGELVKLIVEKVLLALKKNYTHIPDNLVGMEHHEEEMMGLLDVDFKGVRIVGVHGMGGIGKTTMTKVIYNKLVDHFEFCCFLEDVREKSQHPHGLVDLQNQFVSKISKGNFSNIVDVEEGIKRIKDTVGGKKVLMVLDDIDEKFQFDKLVGNCDWFGSGSRIIVTTRNKDILDSLEAIYQKRGQLEVFKGYEPELMNFEHSLQLFSKYAFMRDCPLEGYDILSKKFVSTAAGLPLVLVTMGSLLFGKEDKDLWVEILRKLEKIPHYKVMGKLRISFDALEYEQKQIFLDVACLFIGEEIINPFHMWDDCELYPRNGIKVLVLRCLIKVGDDNRLWMHDHLRDLGRQIVREENLSEPEERSRLWHREEALDVLERRVVIFWSKSSILASLLTKFLISFTYIPN
ncbi:hypothetical protein LguiA_018682 [Lonicera macranthoides]